VSQRSSKTGDDEHNTRVRAAEEAQHDNVERLEVKVAEKFKALGGKNKVKIHVKHTVDFDPTAFKLPDGCEFTTEQVDRLKPHANAFKYERALTPKEVGDKVEDIGTTWRLDPEGEERDFPGDFQVCARRLRLSGL